MNWHQRFILAKATHGGDIFDVYIHIDLVTLHGELATTKNIPHTRVLKSLYRTAFSGTLNMKNDQSTMSTRSEEVLLYFNKRNPRVWHSHRILVLGKYTSM